MHSKIRNNSTTASYSKCGTNKAVITYSLETAKEFDLLTLNSCSGFFSRGVPLLSLMEINPQGLKFALFHFYMFVQMWDPERQQCLCRNRAGAFLLSEVKSTLRITCICVFIRFLRIVFLCSLPQAEWNSGRWDYPVIKLTPCAAFQHFLYLISREGTPSLSHKAVPILLMGLYRISC